MELSSKQRAQLRGLANSIDTILIVGVLENSLMSAREAAEALAPLTRSEVVQVIGTKFVLYRPSHRKDKKDKIVLVEDKKKRGV